LIGTSGTGRKLGRQITTISRIGFGKRATTTGFCRFHSFYDLSFYDLSFYDLSFYDLSFYDLSFTTLLPIAL
jgi:hypothetical protein